MRLRKLGIVVATVMIMFAVAPAGKANEVSDARKAIQAAYDKESAAMARLDVKGMGVAHSPEFFDIYPPFGLVKDNRYELPYKTEAMFLQVCKSFRRKVSIQKFRLEGNVATVDCASHEVIIVADPDTNKPAPPVIRNDFSQDTWVKGDQEWLMTSSRSLNSEHPPKPADVRRKKHQDLTESFPHEAKAIRNGEQLIQALSQKESLSQTQSIQSWVGKPVAFKAVLYFEGAYMAVGVGRDGIPIKLTIHFVRPPARNPIVLGAYILGTIQSIDMETQTITIEASEENWHISSTG